MQSVLDPSQRQRVPELLLHRLKQTGKTIRDLKSPHPGDLLQLPHQDSPVWHKKRDLDEWIATQLHLPELAMIIAVSTDGISTPSSRHLIAVIQS